MFHSPPRPRASRRTRGGSRSQGCGRTSAARFFVSGGSVPPTRQTPATDDTHRCRHARSRDSQAIRGRTRGSRPPWRGPRAPVGGAPKCVRSPATRATSARSPVADAAASGCHGTRAGSREEAPAWEFREGRRRERVTLAATGSDTVAPPALRPGGAIFVCGLTPAREVADGPWRRRAGEGWPAGAEPEARRTRLPVQGRASRRATHSKDTERQDGSTARGRSSAVERLPSPTPRPGFPGRRRRVIDFGSRGRGFESRRLHARRRHSRRTHTGRCDMDQEAPR